MTDIQAIRLVRRQDDAVRDLGYAPRRFDDGQTRYEVAGSQANVDDKRFGAVARIDMMGEIDIDPTGAQRFSRGVSAYPAIGDAVRIIGRDDLRRRSQSWAQVSGFLKRSGINSKMQVWDYGTG